MADHEEPLVSLPMRPLDTVERPQFEVPAGAWDVHMHVFGPEALYPRVPHPHYTLPDGNLEHFLELIKVLHLENFVIVQPSYYDTDNSCLLDALAKAGKCARGVVMIEDDTPLETLQEYKALGVCGVRLDLFKRAKLPLKDIQDYINLMIAKVAPLGWHIQFYAPGYIVRDLIDFLADLPIDYVIDHMGYMLQDDGLTDADFSRLVNLMKTGRCYLKLSAPYRLAKWRGYEAVEKVAIAIVKAAPERALWGSDWPHIPQGGLDTGELLNLLIKWAPDPETRRMILSENPKKLFKFD